MNLLLVRTIFRKELLDTLRDKRTLVAMLVVPVLLYPALFIGGAQVALVQQSKLEEEPSRVAVDEPGSPLMAEWLRSMDRVIVPERRGVPGIELAEGRLEAVVVCPPDMATRIDAEQTVSIAVHYDATRVTSREAAHRIAEQLQERSMDLLATRLESIGMAREFARPLTVTEANVASPSKAAGTILGMVLPLLMVVMVGIGAFYPAIDLTAGEKERGTFETLLSAPASTAEIVCGKYLAVFLLSMMTGLLNLASLMLTFAFEIWQFDDKLGIFELSFPPSTAILIVLALIPLALLISAVMMSIAVCAQSFREAQSFVTPFLLLILFPAAYVAVPDSALTETNMLIPITNVALLFKALMMGDASLNAVFAVMVSTGSYAILALILAARLFQREEVILSEEHGIPLTWRRSAFTPQPTPTAGTALMILAVCLLLLFYVGSYLQGRNIIWGSVATQWGLILAPSLLLLWYLRVDIVKSLNLRRPSPAALAAALVLGIGWVILAVQGSYWQSRVLPLPDEVAEVMGGIFDPAKTGVGLVGVFFAIAVSPAICEEALFRGVLLNGLRKRLPPLMTLVAVGVFFGVAHLSFHKAPLTVVSGIVLAYVVWRSRSLFAGIAVHLMNNSFGVLAGMEKLPSPVQNYLESDTLKDNGLPLWVILIGAAMLGVGVLLMETVGRSHASEDPER
ncbi:MAG: CPBP family intramembrane metalloprotease [bacterium]|nr:CPBP family intramembrane metalloprotease [bacterium]